MFRGLQKHALVFFKKWNLQRGFFKAFSFVFQVTLKVAKTVKASVGFTWLFNYLTKEEGHHCVCATYTSLPFNSSGLRCVPSILTLIHFLLVLNDPITMLPKDRPKNNYTYHFYFYYYLLTEKFLGKRIHSQITIHTFLSW